MLSALRKRRRDPNVVAWIGSVSDRELFSRAVTIREVERGIERQRTVDPAFAAEPARWLDTILRTYGERVLPLTVAIARRWGRLSAQIGNRGIGPEGPACHPLTTLLTSTDYNARRFG